MINFTEVEKTIVNALQDFLKKVIGKDVPVIMANQVSPTPEYPYISYTITTPVMASTVHYSVSESGVRYKPLKQIWSFTVQSGAYSETADISLYAYDFFNDISNTQFKDAGIVVVRVGGITNRDNMLSIEYEHRNGFDVTFSLMHTIDASLIENGKIEEIAIANAIKDITITKEGENP